MSVHLTTICLHGSKTNIKNSERGKRMKRIALALSLMMAVSGTVLAADSVTVTGEVIDTSCYSISGAKGDAHRECGMNCIKKGAPAGLLENGTDKVYVLIPKKPMTSLPKSVVEKVAKQVSITGKVFTTGGSQFLTVESIK
jgi:type 1 fimbria pilin